MTAKTSSKTRPLDLAAGENALKAIEPALRAMKQDELVVMTMDAQESALAALSLVDVARDPKRLAQLKLLMPALLAADAIEQLELAAWATWFAHTKLQTEQALSKGAKVDVDTYEASSKHLTKMLKLIEYHVGDLAEVAVELADIRSGTGYQDRASDLVRAASLFERHKRELEGDTRYYDVKDADVARRFAETIVESVRASMGKSVAEWSDLRARAWSRMAHLYSDVRSAGEFVFRRDLEQRDLFAALRQVVVPYRGRRTGLDEAPAADGAQPESEAAVRGQD